MRSIHRRVRTLWKGYGSLPEEFFMYLTIGLIVIAPIGASLPPHDAAADTADAA